MAMLDRVFRSLDARATLGLRIWEFSWRSLNQSYARTVLRRVVARYPGRTLSGVRAYRQWVRSGHGLGPVSPVGGDAAQIAKGARLLVAPGFCQKPLACPAGRFAPDCRVFDAPLRPARLQPACVGCAVRALGERALAAGASLYLMTSAQQIAYDLFLPALAGHGFQHAVLNVCPLSVQPMALMLFICRMRALLLAYGRGACDTHARWLAADRGDKPERTVLAPAAATALQDVLDAAATGEVEGGQWYRREGNVYVPVS
jgi:hypothetical protein